MEMLIITTLLLFGDAYLISSRALFPKEKDLTTLTIASLLLLFSLITAITHILGWLQILSAQNYFYSATFLTIMLISTLEKSTHERRFWPIKFSISEKLFVLPFITILLLSLFWQGYLNSFVPLFIADVLSYHLSPPVKWIQNQGIFAFFATDDRINTLPLGFEIFIAYIGTFIKSNIAIRYTEFIFGICLIPLSYSFFDLILKRTNKGLNIALCCAAMMTPAYLVQLNAARNDLALNVMLLFTLFFLLKYVREPNYGSLVLSGCAAGIAFGIKPIVAPFVAIFFFFSILFQSKLNPKKIAYELAIFGFFVIIFGSPWYLKNYIVYGHPFTPILESISRMPLKMNKATSFLGYFHFVFNNFMEYIKDLGGRNSTLGGSSGFGLAFYCLLLPCLVASVLSWKSKLSKEEKYIILATVTTLPLFMLLFNGQENTMRYGSWLAITPFIFSAIAINHQLIFKQFVYLLLAMHMIHGFIWSHDMGDLDPQTISKYRNLPSEFRTSSAVKYVQRSHIIVERYLPQKHGITKLVKAANSQNLTHSLHGPKLERPVHFCPSKYSEIPQIIECMTKNESRLLALEKFGGHIPAKLESSKDFLRIDGSTYALFMYIGNNKML